MYADRGSRIAGARHGPVTAPDWRTGSVRMRDGRAAIIEDTSDSFPTGGARMHNLWAAASFFNPIGPVRPIVGLG